MENIRCTVERITYQNEENGWSVLRVNVKGYKDVVTLVGNFCDTKVGAVLAVEGNWRMDAKFGKQFQAVNWKEELPSSIVGIEKYLGSGLIKGIGPVYAKKIVAKFGEETLNIIEEDIQRLSEVDGIGKKRIDLIAKSWEKQKDVKDIMVFLQGNRVSSAYAAKIYKAYGKESRRGASSRLGNGSACGVCVAGDVRTGEDANDSIRGMQNSAVRIHRFHTFIASFMGLCYNTTRRKLVCIRGDYYAYRLCGSGGAISQGAGNQKIHFHCPSGTCIIGGGSAGGALRLPKAV